MRLREFVDFSRLLCVVDVLNKELVSDDTGKSGNREIIGFSGFPYSYTVFDKDEDNTNMSSSH